MTHPTLTHDHAGRLLQDAAAALADGRHPGAYLDATDIDAGILEELFDRYGHVFEFDTETRQLWITFPTLGPDGTRTSAGVDTVLSEEAAARAEDLIRDARRPL